MDNNLREVLMPLAIFGGLGTSVYFFVRVMTDYMLRKKMIDKGFVNDDTQAIFKQQISDAASNKFPSLKWGLIALFAGLALILMEFIPTSPESPLPYGLMAVAISLGFLIYYVIISRSNNK